MQEELEVTYLGLELPVEGVPVGLFGLKKLLSS